MRVLSTLSVMVVTYLVLNLPFQYVDSIAGWDRSDLLVLISIYYLSISISRFFFSQGIGGLHQLIRSGDFDMRLLKPVNSSFLVGFFRVDIARLGDIVISVLFLSFVLIRNDFNLVLVEVFSSIVAVFSGLWVVFCINLVVNSLNFWFIESYMHRVTNLLLNVVKYPLNILPDRLETMFIWVIPAAFISYIPASILLGKTEFGYGILGVLVAFVWGIISLQFWRIAIRHYSSTGS